MDSNRTGADYIKIHQDRLGRKSFECGLDEWYDIADALADDLALTIRRLSLTADDLEKYVRLHNQLIEDASLDVNGYCEEQCMAEDCDYCKLKDLKEAIARNKSQL